MSEVASKSKTASSDANKAETSPRKRRRQVSSSESESESESESSSSSSSSSDSDSSSSSSSEEDKKKRKRKGKGKKAKSKSKKTKGKKKGRGKAMKARKKKDKGAPKRPLTGYIIFSKNNMASLREEMTKEDPDTKQKDVMAEMGKRWRGLSAAEKEKYENMGKEEKIRYQKQLETYEKKESSSEDSGSDSDEKPKKPAKKKAKRDPDLPAVKKTAYMFFQSENSDRIRQAMKDKPGFKNTDVMKEVASQWKGLSESARKPYTDKALKDKQRWDAEMEKYKKTHKK